MTNRLRFALPILLAVSPLHAGLTAVDFFKNIEYFQTTGAAPNTPGGFFVSLREFMATASDFNSASVTYPGPGSPQSLTQSGTVFAFQTGFLASQAAMDAEYPFGIYTFVADNSSIPTSQSTSISYTADAYTAGIPAFTAATFAALQGMDPTAAFTFHFNGFTPNGVANDAATFLTIFGTPFFNSLADTTTSAVLPANTLAPNTAYTMELDFSDRISDSNSGVPTTMGFDVRTDVTFTTGSAVPEPGSLTLGALGVAALAFAIQKRGAGC